MNGICLFLLSPLKSSSLILLKMQSSLSLQERVLMMKLRFEHAIVQILLTLLQVFEILLRINFSDIIDYFSILPTVMWTLIMISKHSCSQDSVLQLLQYFRSTYFTSMNPPTYTELIIKVSIWLTQEQQRKYNHANTNKYHNLFKIILCFWLA